MTEPVKRINLLEGPAFAREVAIQDADAAIVDLDTDLPRRTGGPDIAVVPAAYLPARAWGRSVDVYDPAWPELVRRAVIVASPEVHEHKGAVHAVEVALAALNVDATVTEWWAQTPRGVPYTFNVRAFARSRLYKGPLLDARMVQAVFSSVLRAKPLSRAFDLKVVATAGATLGIMPVITARQRVRRAAVARLDTAMAGGLGLIPAATVRTRVRRAAFITAAGAA